MRRKVARPFSLARNPDNVVSSCQQGMRLIQSNTIAGRRLATIGALAPICLAGTSPILRNQGRLAVPPCQTRPNLFSGD